MNSASLLTVRDCEECIGSVFGINEFVRIGDHGKIKWAGLAFLNRK